MLNTRNLVTDKIEAERKEFRFALKENDNGFCLDIVEDVRGRLDRIVVPAEGLEEFHAAVGRMLQQYKAVAPRKRTPA